MSKLVRKFHRIHGGYRFTYNYFFVDVIDSLRPKSIEEAEKGNYTYWNRIIVSEEILTIRLCVCVVMKLRMLEKKSIDLALQAQKTLYMNIDTYKIDQVIRNLITNAVRLFFCCKNSSLT